MIHFSLRLILGFVLLACLGCGGLGISGATDGTEPEGLSQGETDLFDDGPFDLPVTIAKLESPNPQFIELTANETGPAERRGSAPSGFLSADETYTCDFVGTGHETDSDSRAIPDPVTTPYVLIYDPVSEESVIEAVNADGSFEASIVCRIEQDLIVSAMTSADLSTAAASPGVIFSVDELGTVTVTVTNSSRINDSQPFGSDPFGNLIFSVEEDDGTYTLWRRNLDGSLPDVLLEGHAKEPIVTAAMADLGGLAEDEYDSTIILMDRGVDMTKITEDTAASTFASSGLATGIATIGAAENIMQTKSIALKPIDLDRVLVARPTADGSTTVLEVYWTDGTVNTVISATNNQGASNDFAKLMVSGADLSKQIVAVRRTGEDSTDIFRIDIADNDGDPAQTYATAWANRVTIKRSLPYHVLATAPALDALYLMIYNPNTAKVEFGKIVNGTYASLVNLSDAGINPYPQLISNPEGEFMIVCDQGENVGESQAKLAILDTANVADGFADFATGSKLRSCNHLRSTQMQSTGYKLLHFFTRSESEDSSQLSFINLSTNEIVGPFVNE